MNHVTAVVAVIKHRVIRCIWSWFYDIFLSFMVFIWSELIKMMAQLDVWPKTTLIRPLGSQTNMKTRLKAIYHFSALL